MGTISGFRDMKFVQIWPIDNSHAGNFGEFSVSLCSLLFADPREYIKYYQTRQMGSVRAQIFSKLERLTWNDSVTFSFDKANLSFCLT